jgi:hypothetical protein
LLGNADKGTEIMYGEEKKYFELGQLEQPRQNKNLLYRHDKPNRPSKEGPFSFVLFETPQFQQFNSQRGPPLSRISAYLSYEVHPKSN